MLTEELEALRSSSKCETAQSSVEQEDKEVEADALCFLVDLFRKCTKENPLDRPTAQELYEMLLSRANDLSGTQS